MPERAFRPREIRQLLSRPRFRRRFAAVLTMTLYAAQRQLYRPAGGFGVYRARAQLSWAKRLCL